MTPFLVVPFTGLVACTVVESIDLNTDPMLKCERTLWENNATYVLSLEDAVKHMIYHGYDGRIYEIDVKHQMLIEREVPRVEIGGACVLGCKEK